jgi:hypothetical protein
MDGAAPVSGAGPEKGRVLPGDPAAAAQAAAAQAAAAFLARTEDLVLAAQGTPA